MGGELSVDAASTTGWEAACACDSTTVTPCTILDPFSGSGTSCLVARRLGRHAIGVELSEEYLRISLQRLSIPDPETGTVSSKFVGEGQAALNLDV